MRFTKAHAYGNDFLYIDKNDAPARALDQLARELCERHTGIGADGVIVYERTADGASMRLFNADGGRAEVSGNGVRALGALLLRDDDRVSVDLVIHTEAGAKQLTRIKRDGAQHVFRAAMGQPAGLERTRVDVAEESLDAVLLNMGNPQCVLLERLPADDRFRRLGAALEHHQRFPDGTNVEFVQVDDPGTIRIAIWERGVGPTTSSGTGACASLVAAAAFGGASRAADVISPGGRQHVEWRDDGVYLTGAAEVLFDGEWLR